MCQALQALGVAPCLERVESFEQGRCSVYTSLRSGFAPVLVLQSPADLDLWHAVTAVGLRLRRTPPLNDRQIYDLAGDVLALYVHDDRIGPYQRLDLMNHPETVLLNPNKRDNLDQWLLRYVLVPLHAKIRLSSNALLQIAFAVIGKLVQATQEPGFPGIHPLSLTREVRTVRSHRYLQTLAGDEVGRSLTPLLYDGVPLPRYLGIIQLAVAGDGRIDVLVDTTSTMKNLHCLAVVVLGGPQLEYLGRAIATMLKCCCLSPIPT